MADAPKIILTGPDKDTLFSGSEKINQAIDNANEAKTAVKDVGTAITNANDAATRANSASDTAEARIAELNGVDAVQFKDRQDTFDAQLAETEQQRELSYGYLTNFFNALNKGAATVVFVGDSTTAVQTISGNTAHPNQLQAWLDSKYGAGKVTVINSGIGGNDISMMLRRIRRDCMRYNPDVVVISSGWNDINKGTLDIFEKQYNKVIELVKLSSFKPVDIIVRTQNITNDTTSMNTFKTVVNPATLRVAKKNKVHLADLHYHEQQLLDKGQIEVDPTKPNTINADTTHPNEQGQQIIADFLKPFFDNSVNLTKTSIQTDNNLELDYIDIKDVRVTNVSYGDASNSGQYSYNLRDRALSVGGNYFNKSMSVKFYGTMIKCVLDVGQNYGMVNVIIDGGTPVKLDLYEQQRNTTFTTNFGIFEFTDLTEGEHTLQIINLNEKNAASTDYGVVIHGFIVEKKSSYAYKVKNELTPKPYFALAQYNASDKATKTTTVNAGAAATIGFDSAYVNGTYAALTNNALAVTMAGNYILKVGLRLRASNSEGELRLLINGVNNAYKYFKISSTTSDVKYIDFDFLLQLNANDTISIQLINFTGSEPVIVDYISNSYSYMRVMKVN